MLLPVQPIFNKMGHIPLPTPPWRSYVFLFQGTHRPAHTPLLCCGDVESNPGPTTVSFTDFAPMAGDFLTAADPTQVARALSELRLRTRNLVLQGTALTLDRPDAERLCAAYEVFSGCTLELKNGTFSWLAPVPPGGKEKDEIAALRRELDQLRLSQTAAAIPTEASLTSELTEESIMAFLLLSPGPAWMRDMCDMGCFAQGPVLWWALFCI